MLSFIKISNYALIEHAELEFSPAFNVITGESGAGKSLLMGAVKLLLGGRVDHSIIRNGTERCEVAGCFEVPPQLSEIIASILQKAEIPFETATPELQLRRVIGANYVRNFINDTLVSARLLSTVGEQIIDLHNANEQLSLLSPRHQLEMLDRYAGTGPQRAECENLCKQLAALQVERDEFNRNIPNEAEASQLGLVIEDIEKVNPYPGEDEELSLKYKLSSNSRQILETAGILTNTLTEGENSLSDQLAAVYRQLLGLSRINEKLTENLLANCDNIQESINTLSADINNIASQVELDAEALAAMENRLSDIFTLKRRYGPSLEQVLTTRDEAQKRLKSYTDAQKYRAEFDRQERELIKNLHSAAENLSKLRKAAAAKFTREVQKRLNTIGLQQAVLKVDFVEVPPGPSGLDNIEFMLTTNAGEESRPLRRIASSGELSRLMLALKTVLADVDDIPVAVFDEIDSNISGETAIRVGDELKNLGKCRQILCISHQAQVAARADRHFCVVKHTENGRTFSQCLLLDASKRESEIARMLGGGESALIHARSVLAED